MVARRYGISLRALKNISNFRITKRPCHEQVHIMIYLLRKQP